MGSGFVEGRIAGEKVFEGLVFPKTLTPPTGSATTDDLVEIVRSEQSWISDVLSKHGAVLFRGFDLSTALDFARVVEALGWDDFGYRGAVERMNPADRVFTANESPIHLSIGFHHEMALIKEFPAKLLIFCGQPSPEGGETGIVRSDIVVKKMEEELPEVVEKLEKEGVKFVLHRAKDVWPRLLKTHDKAEAEKTAIETLHGFNSITFNEDGSAEFNYGPFNPVRELDGARVWFNTIVGFVTEQADLNACYGDGTLIPKEVLDTYHRILAENCVDVKWQKGDVLVVDNHKAQHARRPGTPPRMILVSLCK